MASFTTVPAPAAAEATSFTRHWIPVRNSHPRNEGTATTPASFTMLSWNVLAQCLVRRSLFEHCSTSALKWAYRRTLLLKEIQSISADILCLQECDFYEEFWRRGLEDLGYDSIWMCKPFKRDGCAIAWNRSKFSLQEQRELQLNSLAEGTEGVTNEELTRNNIALLVKLRWIGGDDGKSISMNDQGIVIATTHLFWNPLYCYVRLKQLHMILNETLRFARSSAEEDRTAVLLCGDFNMRPNTVVYKAIFHHSFFEGLFSRRVDWPDACDVRPFLIENAKDLRLLLHEFRTSNTLQAAMFNLLTPPEHIDPNVSSLMAHVDSSTTNNGNNLITQFLFQSEEEIRTRLGEVVSILADLRSNFPPLASAYGDYTTLTNTSDPNAPWNGEPPFTTFGQHFRGTLDYIFYFDHPPHQLCLTDILEIPSADELSAQIAIPNDFFPSDHVSLVVRFSFPQQQQG